MKKTACWLLILSMLLLLALPAGAAEKTPAFADAGDIRNGYAVRMLVDLGLIVGDNDGNFRPAAPITRAETAKLIACLCTDTFLQTGGASFADTAESWARDYIAYCASRGIVGGSGGYFRPQDDVTAQELAKMLLVVTGSDGARYTGAGWSERVNADAEKYGLYHAFSGRYDLPVTRDDACLLIYNAMQRPAVDGENADGTPRYVLDALMNKRTYLEVRFDAVRGNISEIKTLCTGSGTTKGVDADAVDAVTEANLDDGVALVKAFARQAGCIIAVTGAIDLVSDGERCWCIRNGRPEMSRITGTGCQLSALTTAFLVANPGHKLEAAAAAVCTMGLAGEIGWANMQPGDGNSTYRNRIIDAICNMTGDTLEEGAKYELR